jgi:hypothetical protein
LDARRSTCEIDANVLGHHVDNTLSVAKIALARGDGKVHLDGEKVLCRPLPRM